MRRLHENILLHLILDRSPHPNVDPYQLRLNSWLTENIDLFRDVEIISPRVKVDEGFVTEHRHRSQ